MLSPATAAAPPPPPADAAVQAAELQDELRLAHEDLERLQRLLGDADPALTQAETLRRAMAHMAQAITAMQFQDLASQLIDHSSRRLRRCAHRVAGAGPGNAAAEAAGAELDRAPLRPNPVTQDEMDAGSVDLF